MQTIAIVLNVARDRADEFERGFRARELPIWKDLAERRILIMATLNRLDISTVKTEGAVQFLDRQLSRQRPGRGAFDAVEIQRPALRR